MTSAVPTVGNEPVRKAASDAAWFRTKQLRARDGQVEGGRLRVTSGGRRGRFAPRLAAKKHEGHGTW
jgi:hypothetical protein